MKIEIILTILGSIGAAFKWIYEYSKHLKWEKNKFLLDQLEDFHSLPTTQIMETLLDWNSINVKIDEQNIFVDDDVLYDALQTHNFKHDFTKEEFKLRGVFDDYFDNLTKLVFMSKTNLVSKENLILFMGYWLDILSGRSKNKPHELILQIHKYLEFYGYDELKKFIDSH